VVIIVSKITKIQVREDNINWFGFIVESLENFERLILNTEQMLVI